MSKFSRAFTVFGISMVGVVSSVQGHAEDHSHSHDKDEMPAKMAKKDNHAKFGHMNALYECGDAELQTTFSKTETSLTYKKKKVYVSRVQRGETEFFSGTFEGQDFTLKAKGHDVLFEIGAETLTCEKLSCIPLDGPMF